MQLIRSATPYIFFVLAVWIFIQGLGLHGFEYRDDEIFYYQSTKEMIETGNYLSPTYFGEDRFQKPILFYWFIVLSYKLFGVSWFAARFPSVIFGALTVFVTWFMARDLFDRRTANLSALILLTMPLFLRHAKNAVPDMALTFFITLALYCVMKFISDPSRRAYRIGLFLSCGLGFMIKGFTALIFPVGVFLIYIFFSKQWELIKKARFAAGFLIILAIVLPWFIYMIAIHGKEYVQYMLVSETKDRLVHNFGFFFTQIRMFFDHLFFYFRNIMSYFAPWSVLFLFALGAAVLRVDDRSSNGFYRIRFLLLWIGFVYVFFSLMFFTINHYLMALIVPSAIVTAYGLSLADDKVVFGKVGAVVQKSFISVFYVLGIVVFTVLMVFILSRSSVWAVLSAVMIIAGLWFIIRSKGIYKPAFLLSVLIAVIYAQSPMLVEAGVTVHSTFQKIAKNIYADAVPFRIVIASHDIHEKEAQIYFDKQLSKIANGSDQDMGSEMRRWLLKDGIVYCLVLKKDFDRYYPKDVQNVSIFEEEYIFRRRLALDDRFLLSIIRFDQQKVKDYLMEKMYVLKKVPL